MPTPYKTDKFTEKISKSIIDFFNAITDGWEPEKKKHFFNDAVFAVYLQLCYVYLVSINSSCKGKKKDIIEEIVNYVNSLSDEEISERRKLSNSADKKLHLGVIINEIRKKYICFGYEIPTSEKPFKERFIQFEGEFREWVVE